MGTPSGEALPQWPLSLPRSTRRSRAVRKAQLRSEVESAVPVLCWLLEGYTCCAGLRARWASPYRNCTVSLPCLLANISSVMLV